VGTDRFCHIFQLKATDGDNGAPLVTVSLKEGRDQGQVHLWSGSSRGAGIVRRFKWTPGEWHRTEIVITTSPDGKGSVLASVNGDALIGLKNVAVFRPDATDFRPKWGFYRGTTQSLHVGEDWVEHRKISAQKISEPPSPAPAPATQPSTTPADQQGGERRDNAQRDGLGDGDEESAELTAAVVGGVDVDVVLPVEQVDLLGGAERNR
jgi:hypothetical protein